MELWDSWIAIGLISAAAWGLSCVIDACFVADGVFREPLDGALVAGLFCIVPTIATGGSVTALGTEPWAAAVGLIAGLVYLLHIYFYFKALFALNDASNAEIFNTLSVVFVPVFAFFLLGEVLSLLHYFAIGLSIAGVLLLVRFQVSSLTWRVVGLLGISVLCISLAMVMQAWVLESVAYGTAVLSFSLGALICVVTLMAAVPQARRRILRLFGRFGLLLAAVQLLELTAALGSQRATDVGPSVSLVALLECSLPVFVMAFSWMLLMASRHWESGKVYGLRATLALQSKAYPGKLLSLLLIVLAIGLVQP